MTTHAPSPRESIADYFDHAEVTPRMVRTLARIGPGGMIIADFRRREFRATHTRTLDPGDELAMPVFGHGDLVTDPDLPKDQYGSWEAFAAAVDCTAYDCMTERIADREVTPYAVIRMRQRLQELGFDMNTAPLYHRRYLTPGGLSVLEVRETYIDRAHPHLTLDLKHPLTQITRFSLITIGDRGRHVTGWPTKIPDQFVANMQAYEIRTRVNAYLARTR